VHFINATRNAFRASRKHIKHFLISALLLKQELSYRTQIAHQLCRQYVEGIYRHHTQN